MQKTNLIYLVSNEGMYLTNGEVIVKSTYLNENQSVDDWSEITEAEFKKLTAKMTPREFILKLMKKGITRAQLETLINSSDQVWAELNYATLISRANPLLDELCGQFGLTPADVDEMFGV